MTLAGAYQGRLVAEGPRGEATLDAYGLRVAWKYGGYAGPFPGVRRAARRMLASAPLRLVLVLVVAAWMLLIWRPAPARVPAPAYDAPRPPMPDLASERMTTGPPAAAAIPEVPVIGP